MVGAEHLLCLILGQSIGSVSSSGSYDFNSRTKRAEKSPHLAETGSLRASRNISSFKNSTPFYTNNKPLILSLLTNINPHLEYLLTCKGPFLILLKRTKKTDICR